MKNVKMVVMDVDDTLLTSDLEISDYTAQVIANCQQNGIRVVLASGRPKAALTRFSEQLNLGAHGGYMISYNGAIVTDCASAEDVSSTLLEEKDTEFLLDIAEQNDVWIHTYVGDEILTPESNEYTDFESELTGIPQREVKDFRASITEPVVKILMLQEPKKLKAFSDLIRSEVEDRVTMNISKPFFLEFTNHAVDKSRSIAFMCNRLGITMDEVMAIGDSYNDLTMIRDAGLGIAMANAPDDVKIYANHITHSNDADGVATALNRSKGFCARRGSWPRCAC